MGIHAEDGWIVTIVVDSDSHLNIYIEHESGTDIDDIESTQGNGKDGEQLALRFTTNSIEKAYDALWADK